MKTKVELYAPEEFNHLPPEILAEYGCGPGGIGDILVPDTVWFLSIKPACKRHDYMYEIGKTEEDKQIADRVFRNNMIRIIVAHTHNKWLLRRRLKRAHLYYKMVRDHGGPFYWEGKNKPEELQSV